MPPRITQDRRFDERHPGSGLIAVIEGVEMEVLDISIGGIKLPVPPSHRTWRGQMMEFELRSTHWPDMKVARGKGEVRALAGQWMALQFVRPSYDLMKCVSRHVAGLVWGDKPYGY